MSSGAGGNFDENFDGLSSLVRLTGVSVPARARFVGETLLGSTVSGFSRFALWFCGCNIFHGISWTPCSLSDWIRGRIQLRPFLSMADRKTSSAYLL